MKKILSTVMLVLFVAVFTLDKLPLYTCVKQGTLHILSSCCNELPLQETSDSCCSSHKSHDNGEPSLKETCCSDLDAHLDNPYTLGTEIEVSAIKVKQAYADYLIALDITATTQNKLSLGGNKSPPSEAFLRRPLASPIFTLYCSYLC